MIFTVFTPWKFGSISGKSQAIDLFHNIFPLAVRSPNTAGFIAVREMSGRSKISQGQGIVREFYKVSEKFLHLAKLMKNVMEFHIMSGKMTILDNMTLQSLCILTN